MMRLWLAMVIPFVAACTSSSPDSGATPSRSPGTTTNTAKAKAPKPDVAPKPGDQVAYFAGGCFWGVEHYLQELDGVASVESGFMGGHVRAPSYYDVVRKKTGHVETVRVYFDPKRVSYETLAQRFFEIHDPTQTDGQGPDLGPQYLSVVFYTSDAQKKTAQGLMDLLRKRGYKVATTLRPAAEFWKAEEGHQDYYAKNGKKPYCHARVDRFGTGISE